MEEHIDHCHGHSRSGRWGLVRAELLCHMPYAIISVAIGLALLAFTIDISGPHKSVQVMQCRADALFHIFHFMHIVFASTGALITFFRYSKNFLLGILVGSVSPAFFCILSDVVLPYIAGTALGVHMHFHVCFIDELPNILPFLVAGMVNGYILGRYHQNGSDLYSICSHAIHIFVSSLAASFFLVSHGFTDYLSYVGIVFLFLVGAVVIPCTLSDVVVPILFAHTGGVDNAEHSSRKCE